MVFAAQIPKRHQVHARGYNDFYDMPYHIFHEINGALQSCKNIPDFAFVFNKYENELTDF